MKTALILGVGGQDGSYLADVLLERGYTVHGLYRHASYDNLHRVSHLVGQCGERFVLHRGDVTDGSSVQRALWLANPTEMYNLADQDNVGWSVACPELTVNVTARAVGVLLELVRNHTKRVSLFQPVSATMFGSAPPPQYENTPLDPMSPYACAKAHAYHLCRYYRRAYGLNVFTGIMFNHDSPRRKPGYLLQDICRGVRAIVKGQADRLTLRDLDLRVDIGYARDYMEAVNDMVQRADPDDYCIGSCDKNVPTIRAMANCALQIAGCDLTRPLVRKAASETTDKRELIAHSWKAQAAFDYKPRTNWGQLIEMIYRSLS